MGARVFIGLCTARVMLAILGFCRKLSWFMAMVGGAALLLLAGVICFEVFARKLFAFSTKATEEYSGYSLAICISWAIGFTLLERAHVRIDLLYRKVPQPAASAMDLVSLVAIFAAVLVMTIHAYTVFQFNFEFGSRANTTLQTLLWIPQGLWLVGFVVFDLIAIVLIAAVISYTLRADHLAVRSIAGPRGLEAEIESELEAAIRPARLGSTDKRPAHEKMPDKNVRSTRST